MAGLALRIASVFVDFKSNDAQFQEAAKKTRTAVNRLRREMRPMIQTAKRLGIAVTAMGGGFAYATRRIAEQIDQMAKFSRASRGTIRDMQILKRSAGLQGIAFDKLQVSMKRMDVALGTLADGTAGTLVSDNWAKMGLSIEEVINLPLEKRLRVILTAINDQVPAAERAATATALFGARMAGLMLQLSQGGVIERATKEIEAYGGALTEAQKIGVEAANDAIDEITHAFEVLSWQLVARHAPAIRRWAERITDAMKEGGKFRVMMERMSSAGTFLVNTITNLTLVLNQWINRTTASIAAFGALLIVIGKTVKMVIAIRNAVVASGLVIAALTTGVGGVLKIMAALGLAVAGTRAVMMTLDDTADDHNTTISKMNDNYSALVETLDRAKGALRNVWQETVRATQANLDQMEVDLERRAAQMGRSEEYQEILAGIAQAQKDEAQAQKELVRAQTEMDALGFMNPRAVTAQRKSAIDEARHGALAAVEAARARREAFEGQLAARKAEIEKEEQELADIRKRVQMKIMEEETRTKPIKREVDSFLMSNKDTVWGPIGLRPQDRDLDVSNRDTVWGPIGLRTGEEGGEGPDHARAAQLRRRFEDSNPLIQSSTFSKLRALHREYADIRKEITALGPTYASLQGMADKAFQAAKRHAMGITFVTEEAVMLADSIKDRMQNVVGDMVDDFFDGTNKMSESFRRMTRQIVKDMIWMRARSALSAVGNTVFGGIGSTLFPSPGLPGTNPGVALGGPHTIPQFASGGRHMGGPAWVGERGPELVDFDGPATIYDAGTSRRMANRVDVSMRLSGDVSAIADQIRNQIGAAAGPLAQQIMGSVNEQIRNPSDTRRLIRGATA